MNVNPKGKQRKLHDTVIPLNLNLALICIHNQYSSPFVFPKVPHEYINLANSGEPLEVQYGLRYGVAGHV